MKEKEHGLEAAPPFFLDAGLEFWRRHHEADRKLREELEPTNRFIAERMRELLGDEPKKEAAQ